MKTGIDLEIKIKPDILYIYRISGFFID